MRGGGGQIMSVFVHAQGIKTVHAGGEGVKKWQNSVHVVVECPLRYEKKNKMHFYTIFKISAKTKHTVKSVHFKKPVTRISFLSKALSFSI